GTSSIQSHSDRVGDSLTPIAIDSAFERAILLHFGFHQTIRALQTRMQVPATSDQSSFRIQDRLAAAHSYTNHRGLLAALHTTKTGANRPMTFLRHSARPELRRTARQTPNPSAPQLRPPPRQRPPPEPSQPRPPRQHALPRASAC